MATELDDDEVTGLERPLDRPATMVDPRQMAMDVIYRGRIDDFNKETGGNVQFEDPDSDPDDAAAELARAQLDGKESHHADLTQVEDSRVILPDDQIAKQLDDVPKMVKVKIDGQEREVSMDDLVRNYQIDGAAQNRLQEATRTLREATEVAERMKSAAQPAADVDNDLNSKTPAPTPPATLVKEAVDALFAGDSEAATAKLSQIVAGTSPQTPALDIDAVASRVQERMQVDSALTAFRSTFPKLLDPDLAYLTDARISALQKEGKTLAEAIPLAGAALYDKFGFKTEEPKPVSPSASRPDRVQRKAAASDSLPIRAISAGGRADPENEEQSVSDVLSEMRARRPGT